MRQHQKYVKDLEADGGHHEEVDGDQLLGMILQKCAPSLRRWFALRTKYLLTLLSPMSMPSLAAHRGSVAHPKKDSLGTSCESDLGPHGI
jgi:hypothetical protein